MTSELVFIHGGGDEACSYDKAIADRLQDLIGHGRTLRLPRFKGLEALDWGTVAAELGSALRALPAGAIVIAHSIGGAAVVKLLAGGLDPDLAHLFLLAPPYNGADGEWGDGDFEFAADFAEHLPPGLPITLYHSEDDDVIPVVSAERYREKLTAADVVILHGYGHQFTGPLEFLADAVRAASA